ncbi:MFS transporter [Chloroflexota bacterium]
MATLPSTLYSFIVMLLISFIIICVSSAFRAQLRNGHFNQLNYPCQATRKPFMWGAMIALAICAWVAINVSLPLSWPLMALLGFAFSSMIPIVLALPIEMVPREAIGIASGMVISIGNIGGVIGPYIGGRIFDLTGSLDRSLLLLIGIAIAGAGLAFRLPETGPRVRGALHSDIP